MPESFAKLVDTTIGASQLDPDGEHTILTTNGSTSHVLKDVYVTSSKADGSTKTGYLELNGENIGDVSGSGGLKLSGNLIMPENSTLKYKTSDYPFSYNMTWTAMSDNQGYLYWFKYIEDPSNGDILNETYIASRQSSNARWGTKTNNSGMSYWSDCYDIMYADGTGSYDFYWISSDSNSVQTYNRTGTHGSYTSTSHLLYQNYKSYGVHDDIMRQHWSSSSIANNDSFAGGLWNMDGSTMMHHLLSIYPTSYGGSSYGWSGTWPNSNGHSPSPTSSYPRGQCEKELYMYVPSNSYPYNIYAKSLRTGQFFNFQFPNSYAMNIPDGDFQISVDEATNTLYFYRWYNATSIIQDKFTGDTFTNILNNGYVVNSRKDWAASNFTQQLIQLPVGINTSYGLPAKQFGNTTGGGFRYYGNDGKMHTYDKDGNKLYDTGVPTYWQTTLNPSTPRLWKTRSRPTTASEMTQSSLSTPTVKITVTGITST